MKKHTQFSKAPIIGCNPLHGIYLEAPFTVGSDDDEDFVTNVAIPRYGHLVPVGREMAGAQWVEAIEAFDNDGDAVSMLRRDTIVQRIRQLMLVEQFPHARIATKSVEDRCVDLSRTLHDLGACGTPLLLHQGGDDVRSTLDEFLGCPPGWRINPDVVAPESLLGRMQAILIGRQVGPETFSAEAGADLQANLEIALRLMQRMGYGTLVTSSSGMKLGRQDERPSSAGLRIECESTDDVDQSIFRAVLNWVRSEWDGTSPVFLCRPAPLENPLAAIGPFESLVHRELIGWRLPRAMVDHFVDYARQAVGENEASHTPDRQRA